MLFSGEQCSDQVLGGCGLSRHRFLKFVGFHGLLPGHDVQQADAEQAYLQADFEGEET